MLAEPPVILALAVRLPGGSVSGDPHDRHLTRKRGEKVISFKNFFTLRYIVDLQCCDIFQVYTKVVHSCPTLDDPMDCSPPGSSVHGILQARTLGWVAMPSSRGSSQPRDQTGVSCVSCIDRRVLYYHRHRGSLFGNIHVLRYFVMQYTLCNTYDTWGMCPVASVVSDSF